MENSLGRFGALSQPAGSGEKFLLGALLIGVLLQNKNSIIVLFNSERLSDKRFSVSAR